MKEIFRKPYFYWIILISLAYFILNFFISGFYNSISLIIKYANTINWFKLSFSIILSLIIGFLVSINIVYALIKYRERTKCLEASAVTAIGTIGGLATGFCPLCITGLFPLVLSLFGISFTFASLPFQGLEVQILVIVILFVAFLNLNKR